MVATRQAMKESAGGALECALETPELAPQALLKPQALVDPMRSALVTAELALSAYSASGALRNALETAQSSA